jgi:hypothetical protein
LTEPSSSDEYHSFELYLLLFFFKEKLS